MPRTSNQQKKLHVKKGDKVMLIKDISGALNIANSSKSKGYIGRVLQVFPSKERVIIEGVNLRFRHTKPSQNNQQGGRIEKEMPIHASNVLPVDSAGNATRVGRKQVVGADGKSHWVRYAKTTGEELDK
jgi:large subunit ribosomal protein L24